MEYRRYETELTAGYNRRATQYRHDDEIEARSENHQRLGGNLRRICRSFARPVRVLEIGCGTGRYFHWLQNVALLVGTDLSAEMLKQAARPVRADEVTAREIRLLRGNIYAMDFEAESFDFIYSLGVFGYGAALTPELGRKIHGWLSAGGRLYFDAIEHRELSRAQRFKQSVKSAALPVLPATLKARLEARAAAHVPLVVHTRADVERVMEGAGFTDFAVSSNTCHSPLWSGVHLECYARKNAATAPKGASVELEPVENAVRSAIVAG
jgi:SAM-dependent methyltransferase